MKILVVESAFRQYGDRIGEQVPEAEFLVLGEKDHVMRTADGAVANDTSFEVAWASASALQDEGPGSFTDLVNSSKTVKWLHTTSAAADRPVIKSLLERNALISNSHVQSIAIAEYVLRAVLDEFQRPELWRKAQDEHEWQAHGFREVYRTTWLVFGIGAIGSAVATRARAFGARVIGTRRTPTGDEPVDEMIAPSEVRTCLSQADVVVLAAPATPTTHHLVDRDFLSRMKPKSVIVNVARGALIDDEALIEALDNGIPEAAILDVFATEPLPPEHPLWGHARVRISPHNSFSGSGVSERRTELFVENLVRYRDGRPLLHPVTHVES